MLVTLLGMVIEVSEEQDSKAQFPILITLLGIVSEVREEPSKAANLILLTLLGIIVFLQPATNALVAVSIIALQLLRLSYFTLLVSTTIEVSEEQEEKAPSLILVTLLGMVSEVSEEQEEKARAPILVTLLGIVIEVSEEQYWKA